MLGSVAVWPEWHDVLISGVWMAAKVALFAAVLVYPWPKGTPHRMLQVGAGCLATQAVWGFVIFSGLFGPPPILEEGGAGLIPELLGYLEIFALQFGGNLLLGIGAWRTARFLARHWGRKGTA